MTESERKRNFERRRALLRGLLAGLSMQEAARQAGYAEQFLRKRPRALWRTASNQLARELVLDPQGSVAKQFKLLSTGTGVPAQDFEAVKRVCRLLGLI
jgi:hypothetical protein